MDPAPTLLFTAPANDGNTVTAAILVNTSTTFSVGITDNAAINASGISWSVTSPGGTTVTPAGTLAGSVASLQALLDSVGTWTVSISYNDGVNAAVTASLQVPVLASLPPALQWIAPANDGTTVTGMRRVGSVLGFQASLTDDDPLQPLSVQWSVTPPTGTATTSQGTYTSTGVGTARLDLPLTLSQVGTYRVAVQYTDGVSTVSLALDAAVVADLAPSVTFTAPGHDSTGNVTVPVAVGDSLQFAVAISDDTAIVAGNGTFVVTAPGGTPSNVPSTVNINGNGNSATSSVQVTFNAAGTWTVAYQYTDGAGQLVTATLTIVVATDPAPSVDITSPANDGTRLLADVRQGAGVTFVGQVTDNLAINALQIGWTYTPASGAASTSQGVISGTGNQLTTTFTVANAGPAGNATIRLQYTDGSGSLASKTLTVAVLSNSVPTLAITAPANNGTSVTQSVRVDTIVTFSASVSDDAAIAPSGLLWTLVSPGGAITTSPGSFAAGTTADTGTATLAASFTAAGTWTVRLSYTDAQNNTREVQLTITVLANNMPTCTWETVAACISTGQHQLRVTLTDVDGDTPITAQLDSSVGADTLPATVFGNGLRQFTITLVGTGPRTLSCAPTDSTGLPGTVATLQIDVPAAPTISVDAPLPATIVAVGESVAWSVSSTSDATAAPVTTVVTDSMEGELAGAAGTIVAPGLGIHEIRARIADACGGADNDFVRYGVTPTGGALTTLGAAGPANLVSQQIVVRVAAADRVTGGMVLGTSQNGVYGWTTGDAVRLTNTGNAVPTQARINGLGLGAADAVGRVEAYATDQQGLYVCLRQIAAGALGTAVCRNFQQGDAGLQTDQLEAAMVLGSGTDPADVIIVGATQTELHFWTLAAGGGGIDLVEVATVNQGGGDAEFLGDIQAVAAGDPTGLNTLNPVLTWIGTDLGVALVTLDPVSGSFTVQHFDDQRTQNLLPDYDVQAIAVDPGNPEQQWFVTAGGMGHHLGPGFAPTTWDSFRATTAGQLPGNMAAIAVDRFPDVARPILWVATRGNGFLRIDPNVAGAVPLGMAFNMSTGIGLPNNDIRTVTIHPDDPAHTKWFGLNNGGLFGYIGH